MLSVSCHLFLVATALADPDLVPERFVPEDRQALLLLKMLSYDATLKRHGRSLLKIGILYGIDDEDGVRVAQAMQRALSGKNITVQAMPAEAQLLPWQPNDSLEQTLANVSAVYLAPGLGQSLDAILKHTRRRSLSVVTGMEIYVRRGAPLGIALDGTRPRMLVHLTAANAHGSSFDTRFLSLCEVIP